MACKMHEVVEGSKNTVAVSWAGSELAVFPFIAELGESPACAQYGGGAEKLQTASKCSTHWEVLRVFQTQARNLWSEKSFPRMAATQTWKL